MRSMGLPFGSEALPGVYCLSIVHCLYGLVTRTQRRHGNDGRRLHHS